MDTETAGFSKEDTSDERVDKKEARCNVTIFTRALVMLFQLIELQMTKEI